MKRRCLLFTAILIPASAFGYWWQYQCQWGSHGQGNGQFEAPSEIDVAPGSNVYVVDSGNDRVQFFDKWGGFLGKWGSYGTGNGPKRPLGG